MVGDRIDSDIVPAKLLGMCTVLFRTGRHHAQRRRSWEERPDAEVHDVAGLARAIDLLHRRLSRAAT
jgi:ribonucleotide monophosphatase NagD (HAD superfamily)